MARDRIQELDALRGLAFAAVALQHVIGMFNQRGGMLVFDKWFTAGLFSTAKFAVPTFVFITGLVMFYNYYDKLNYPKMMTRRFYEIIVPYLIWSLLYTSHNLHRLPVSGEYFRAYARNLVLGGASYHLWFIVLIIQFYVFFPVWRYLFKLAGKWLPSVQAKASVLVLAVLGYYIIINNGFISHFDPAHTILVKAFKYRDHLFLLWFLYFVIGGVVGLNIDRFRTFIKRFWMPCLFVSLGFLLYFAYLLAVKGNDRLGMQVAGSFTAKMALFSFAMIFIAYYGSVCCFSRFRFFNLLGKYSLGEYFAHAYVLHWTYKAVKHFTPFVGISGQVVLTFVLVILGSMGVTLIFSRLPMGKLFVGRV